MDGLESLWVRSWRLRSLLQEYNGEIPLNDFIEKYERIHSLEIWFTFLTGKMPESRLSWYKVKYSRYFIKMLLKSMGLYHLAKNLLMKHKPSFLLQYENVRNYGSNSLPEIIKPSAVINMILYDKNYGSNMARLAKAINVSLKEYEKEAYRQFRLTKEKLFEAIAQQERYKLILAYFRLADSIGHVFNNNRRKLFKAYIALDRLAYLVRREYDGAILILSDHGMTSEGEHSTRSFWSLNIRPLFIPRSIADLNKLVTEIVKM